MARQLSLVGAVDRQIAKFVVDVDQQQARAPNVGPVAASCESAPSAVLRQDEA
ncbi:hypothetical protein SALB1_1428 [Salinisphaera sp. LB1]|nr:hypothetical protein SALB1_1428 [Salinisphaera sp. LB1]